MIRRKLIWAAFLMLFLANLAIVPNANTAITPTNLFIEPPVVWGLNLVPGTQFKVDVIVDYVRYLRVVQFEFGEPLFQIRGWDPSVLRLTKIEIGEWLKNYPGIWVSLWPGYVDNTFGSLSLSWIWIYADWDRYPTGGGPLITLTFEVVGYGTSPMPHFGGDTGLLNRYNRWVIRGENLHDGFFCNVQRSELYIRTHGAELWPEWHVGLSGTEQTLYARIANHGEQGAWVKVKFLVISTVGLMEEHWSNEEWINAKTGEDPELATVFASFTATVPAKYYVCGFLYFKAVWMTEYVPYQMVINMGGEGTAVSRDIAVRYKVKTP